MGKFPRKIKVFKCVECEEYNEEKESQFTEMSGDIYKPVFEIELSEDVEDCYEETDGFKCTNCDELSESEFDLIEEIDMWQCVECDEIHEEKDDAYNCCG